MVVMTLLIDENVPASVVDVFRARGHQVHLITDFMPNGTEDQIIAVTGNRMGIGTVLVTWDKDFSEIISRVQKGSGRLRNLSRITFKCPETQGKVRLEQTIDVIEFVYGQAMTRADKRILIEIRKENLLHS